MSRLMFDPAAMAAVAAATSRSRGVKVTCSGRGAYSTCTKRIAAGGREVREAAINIPAEVLETKADAAALLRGYLDHEAAHVRWTDWSVLEDPMFRDPFWKSLLNIVEDVRVEARMAAAFRGAKDNLLRIAEILFGGKAWRSHAAAQEPAPLALSWLLYRLRSKACPAMETGAKALGALLDAMAPGAREAMESVLSHVPAPDTTREAADLAVALGRAFMARPGLPPEDPEKQEAQAAARKALKEAGMGAQAAKRAAEKAASQDRSPTSSVYSMKDGDVPKGAGAMSDAVNGALDAGSGYGQGAAEDAAGACESAFMARDSAMAQTGRAGRPPRLRARTADEVRAASAVCAGLGQRLRSLLQTQSSVRRGVRASGTRLDARSLWRAGASDGRVFEGRSQGRTRDTEILLLVDASGSMGRDSGDYGRIRMANAAMAGVLSALEGVRGVHAGAVSFSKIDGRNAHAAVKWPMERLSAARLPWVNEYGSTDIPGSMKACAGMFSPETPRKIMIVISDGDCGAREMRRTEDELAAMGVETAGVSVSVPYLQEHMRRCTWAARPEEIPSAVFGSVQSLLLGSGR